MKLLSGSTAAAGADPDTTADENTVMIDANAVCTVASNMDIGSLAIHNCNKTSSLSVASLKQRIKKKSSGPSSNRGGGGGGGGWSSNAAFAAQALAVWAILAVPTNVCTIVLYIRYVYPVSLFSFFSNLCLF